MLKNLSKKLLGLLASMLVASFLIAPNIMASSILLDGTLSPDEWSQATSYDLEYEIMPSRNTPANLKTTAYVKFDEKYLYIFISCTIAN